MKPSRLRTLFLAGAVVLTPLTASATNNLPATGTLPAIVYLRIDCGTLANCATTIPEVQSWMDTYKRPSVLTPLAIEIGPGGFVGSFTCTGYSNLSIKGSGPAITIIHGRFIENFVIKGIDCFNLNVQDLTLSDNYGGGLLTGVYWNGKGSSTWTNVHIDPVGTYAWTETLCPLNAIDAPVHYWFASRLQAHRTAYLAQCSKNWFFGSQLVALGGMPNLLEVFELYNTSPYPAEVHVYGSNIQLKLDDGVSYTTPSIDSTGNILGAVAIKTASGAIVDIHGTGIDIIGNQLPNGVAALGAAGGGVIRASGAAYNLSTGTGGVITRILKDTNPATRVDAPYLWEEHPTPPNITSVTGADAAVVTSGTSDGHSHLVIYDSACASKWYDSVAKVCRP